MARFREYSLGRQLALQFLYGLDFSDLDWRLALPEFWKMDPVAVSLGWAGNAERKAVPETAEEAAAFANARAFAETLIEGTCAARQELESLLTGALDNWRPERVGRIEWVILRMALYELQYCPEHPDAVVISEANRLATLFGDDESPRFISGVLNRFLGNKRGEQEEFSSPPKEPPE
ncbi:MAG: transcription antitermination factor NusB [Candidatus Hydrogenedentes bacterium]|nr:transcription antitermination factor NusB [Candidatus Hydrogenedentota bacterium]